MHIGLIGGIGVGATLVYYKRLTDAILDAGSTPDLTIVHADARTLVANNLADRRGAQAEIYQGLLDRLAAAGADCAAITSLGGHFCFAETAAISPLPLVSGVSPLDAYFDRKGIKRVGLLGAQVVMRTKLYGQLAQTEAVVLEDEIETVGQAYQDMAIAGAATEDNRAFFLDAGARLIRDQGAEAVVLAGTDLGLVFDDATPDYPVIDALDVHVEVLAQLALGEVALENVSTGVAKS